MKIETVLKIIIECFEAVFFAFKRYQTGINEHKKSQNHWFYNDSGLSWIIQTLGRRDLSGCFLVHICVFYSSYSSYFAFLCTSPKIFRAKMEPNILL